MLDTELRDRINRLLLALKFVRDQSNSDVKNGTASENTEPQKNSEQLTTETKLYKRRWLQLGIYFFLSAINSMQWIQFTIIANIISRYYDVSAAAVDWTSIIYYVTYVVLLFPGSYVIDSLNLRWTCLIGSIVTSVGAWIKVFAVSPDRFVLLFFGQTIVASAIVFLSNIPPGLAACWFGAEEVAAATAIGYSGAIAGTSLFFLIVPMIVENHENTEVIGEQLWRLYLAVAIACTVVSVLFVFFFKDEPRLPPSEARALQKINRSSGNRKFWPTLKRILRNKTFLILCNTYGFSLGFYNTIGTLLNSFYVIHFESGETEAGQLGLLMTLLGTLGGIFFGMILDKTKKFKVLNIFIYAFTLLGEILFALGLMLEIKWIVFLSIVVIGIGAISHLTIGVEVSNEATYPAPGELSSGLLVMSAQLYAIALSLGVGSLLRNYGDIAGHSCLTSILTIGLILTLFIKYEHKRQDAKDGSKSESGDPSPS